jgi:ribose-phosphate pyrophosphokinase
MKSLVITDSIEPPGRARGAQHPHRAPWRRCFGQAILNISNGTSVSSLFDSGALAPIYEALYPHAA